MHKSESREVIESGKNLESDHGSEWVRKGGEKIIGREEFKKLGGLGVWGISMLKDKYVENTEN